MKSTDLPPSMTSKAAALSKETSLPAPGSVSFQYLGNSCTLIIAPDGTRIVSDPYQEPYHSKGLKPLPSDLQANVVTISHEHPDHNYAEGVKDNPLVLTEPGSYQAGMVSITAFEGREGSPSGPSEMREAIFMFEIAGIKIVHLGDSGIITDAETLAAIDRADLVIVNIDGYVILAEQIMPFMEQIHARTILPGHYSHAQDLRWNDAPTIEEFLATLPPETNIAKQDYEIRLTPHMPNQVLVLKPLLLE